MESVGDIPGRSEFQAASLAGLGGPEKFVCPEKVTCVIGIAFRGVGEV